MKLEIESCIPPFWARSGHAQTICSHLMPSARLAQRGERVEVELSDGDRLVGRYFEGSSQVVVYAFHGLSGDLDADYMVRVARVAQEAGHSVCLMNHRGCGEGEGLARHPYHSGRGEDISRVIEVGRARNPRKHHVAVGFSLSGNALLCLLTGLRGHVLPDAAISINAPIDLRATALSLESGLNRLYDVRFVRRLRKMLERRQSLQLIDELPPFSLGTSLRDFDALYTAPAGGFTSNDDYYDTCSTARHLEKVSVPTVLLSSHDDPFVPVTSYLNARISKHAILHLEPVGGHIGYLSGLRNGLGATKEWLDRALAASLRAVLEG